MTEKHTVLEHNFHAIGAILRDFKLERVVVTYGGSGDSGDIHEIVVFRGEEPGVVSVENLPDIEYRTLNKDYKPSGWRTVETETRTDFRSALCDITELALEESNNGGWENNEGSDGTLTVFADGRALLEHGSHFEGVGEAQTSDFNTDSEGQIGLSIRALSKVLSDAGVHSVDVDYSGYGDSGNDNDLTVFSAPGVIQANHPVLDQQVTIPTVKLVYNREKQVDETLAGEHTLDVKTALEDLMEDAVTEAGHSGYENNEGGGGTLKIAADGTASLRHTYNSEQTCFDTYTWNDGKAEEGAQ
jgi:hypothetical protein